MNLIEVRIDWDESITGYTGIDSRILVSAERKLTDSERHIVFKLIDDEVSYNDDAEQDIYNKIIAAFAVVGIKIEILNFVDWIQVDGRP